MSVRKAWRSDEGPPHNAVKQAESCAEVLGMVLANRHPAVQSAALADVVAMWVAGHLVPVEDAGRHPEIINSLLETFGTLVRELVPEELELVRLRVKREGAEAALAAAKAALAKECEKIVGK